MLALSFKQQVHCRACTQSCLCLHRSALFSAVSLPLIFPICLCLCPSLPCSFCISLTFSPFLTHGLHCSATFLLFSLLYPCSLSRNNYRLHYVWSALSANTHTGQTHSHTNTYTYTPHTASWMANLWPTLRSPTVGKTWHC